MILALASIPLKLGEVVRDPAPGLERARTGISSVRQVPRVLVAVLRAIARANCESVAFDHLTLISKLVRL